VTPQPSPSSVVGSGSSVPPVSLGSILGMLILVIDPRLRVSPSYLFHFRPPPRTSLTFLVVTPSSEVLELITSSLWCHRRTLLYSCWSSRVTRRPDGGRSGDACEACVPPCLVSVESLRWLRLLSLGKPSLTN